MANRVMLHLLSYNCNLYTGIEDHLKTLNVHEIWNVLSLFYVMFVLMCVCLCHVFMLCLCYVRPALACSKIRRLTQPLWI